MAFAAGPIASTGLRGAAARVAAEARATLALAWPLIVAQLATIALTTTDIVMMGWLGPTELAAGALASSVMFPVLMFATGVSMAAAPLVAQALGARRRSGVRGAVRQGLRAAGLMSLVLTPLLIAFGVHFGVLGQGPEITALGGGYVQAAAWMLPPMAAFMVLRGLVSAHGETRVVLAIALGGVVLNAFGNWVLMFGNLGAPRLELVGAGVSTALAQVSMLAMLVGWVLWRRRYRGYALFAGRGWRDSARLRQILRLGLPIGATLAAESGLFSVAAVLMGWLGPQALAAHAVALQIAAIAFMTPLGLSHATVIRVGFAYGEGDRPAMRRAGWTSIGLAVGFMGLAAALFWFAPRALVGLFLDPADPGEAVPFELAVGYLAVAALFQLVDGAQVTAVAALRGMSDTGVPMAIALAGYWLVGLPVGWALGFPAGLEGTGVWLGLAAGLAFAAVVLMARFAARSRG